MLGKKNAKLSSCLYCNCEIMKEVLCSPALEYSSGRRLSSMLNVVDCAALQFSQVEGNMRKKSKHGVSKAPVLVVAVKTLSSGLKYKAAKA